ncbi:MAG: OmpH family outer membrane protein, partial [Bacteroidales bacterium]|nr:OmpH family outer membrane protein [Bacteroidales bacterium]
EFQQTVDSLPQNIAERRQRELQDMAQRQEQFQQEAYETMQNAQNELMMPIYKKLDETIQEVGKSQGFIYIFDIARTAIPYINTAQSTDLTSSVKSKLGI